MNNSSFEELRKELLKEVYTLGEEISKSESFSVKFNKLIEYCTFSLMEGEDNFFGLFTMQMKRNINYNTLSPLATTVSLSHFILHFNPTIFLHCSLKEMRALIKHEIYHIMFGHFKRHKELRKKYSEFIVNLALDISINQYIENLPSWSRSIKEVSLSYNVDLEYEESAEYYAEKIQNAIDKLIKDSGTEISKEVFNKSEPETEYVLDIEKAHDIWTQENYDFNIDYISELTKKTVENAKRGKVPLSIEKAINLLNKRAEISWKDYLKRALGTMPSGYKKTITRKDRRQPNRLDLRGKLSNHLVQIIIAIDISGSITDKEIDKIMIEVLNIVKNYKSQITIIECDNIIRRVYKVKNKKDVKANLETKGGTAFSPVFEYIYNNKLANYLLIYFTDGVGEDELTVKPINYKTLWVLTGKEENLSLKNSHGEIKKLSNKPTIKNDVNIAIEAMKEITKDWAAAANQYI
ncbi:MAG: peptidase [Clostridium lundense]|nr:peptidase [Clostridium lundense]